MVSTLSSVTNNPACEVDGAIASNTQESLYTVRLIQPEDNAAVEQLVKTVLTEFGCVGEGYAYADPELTVMYETYLDEDARYYVIEDKQSGKIVGGAGFSRLKDSDPVAAICELQKLYFLPETRGHGLGKKMTLQLMAEAKALGFKQMYLETVGHLHAAIHIYESLGFEHIPCSLGSTGHGKCNVHMLRAL